MSDVRDQVRAWLDAHWDPDLTVDEWWRIVAGAGWTAPHFGVEHGGRGLPRRSEAVARSAFAAHGALRPPGGLGLLMAAPTILAHGTPDQIARHVPPILEGRVGWCQLFSEPGAGSDLAGLSTRATRDGDRWVVDGQKVWSSMARQADYGMLLARTDPGVPKHAGISWFALPLDQPGVTIRPLREMTGHAVFNEVFLDGAVCDSADLIGGEGDGWTVTQTTLHFERTGIGAGGGSSVFPAAGPKGGMLGRRAGDAAHDVPPETGQVVLSVAEVVDLARRTGRSRDPAVRQKLAALVAEARTGQWNAQRARAGGGGAGGGGAGGTQALASVGKLAQTRFGKLAAELGLDILGAGGMLAGPDDRRFADAFVFAPASSIYGGSDEIQRNIVAERALGLPREPNPDKGKPFRETLGSA